MGITSGTVPVHQRNLYGRAEFSQAVRTQSGNQFSGQPYRTQLLSVKINPDLSKFLLDHAIIKIDGVRHKNTPLGNALDRIGNLVEYGSILHHVVIDAR